jgi:transcriptional regulator with XRE-family HTH domain
MANHGDERRFRRALGQKIRVLRERRKMTQMDLAKELGFTSTGTISQVENGLKGLSVDSIMKAAKVLGVHPIVLISPSPFSKADIRIISSLLNLLARSSEQPDQTGHLVAQIRAIINAGLKK